MADKYIRQNAGQFAEVEGTVTSAGAGDAGRIPALDSSGKLDNSLMPSGIGADTEVMATSENLSAGDLVNIWNDGGTRKARKADASNGRVAIGFVLSATTSPNNATVYLSGDITGLSSLTPGNPYYVSGATAGAATATAPSTSGHFVQQIGYAVSTTSIAFQPQLTIDLA